MKIILVYFLIFAFWAEQSLGFSLSQIKGLSLMNLAIYLLIFVWMVEALKKKKIFESNTINKYLIFMVCIALLSIALKVWHGEFNQDKIASDLISLKNWVNPFIIFFILFNIIDDKKNCEKIILALFILVVVTAITSPLISLGLVNIGHVKSFYAGRASGFDDPNVYAAFLVLFIPLLISKLLAQKGKINKTKYILALFFTFLALIITGSRGGTISLVISMGVYVLLNYKSELLRLRQIVALVVMVILVAGVSYLFAPKELKETLIERFDFTQYDDIDEASAGRTRWFRIGLTLFSERPILGHGYNTFSSLMKKKTGRKFNSHNEYLAHLIHYGIIGLSVYIMLLSNIFKHFMSCFKNTDGVWSRRLYISYISGFAGYATAMLGVNMTSPRYLFWIYTAVLYKYSVLENNEIEYERLS